MPAGYATGKIAKLGRAPSLRTPLSIQEPPSQPPSDRPLLRLAVSRGGLGIELDAPFDIAPFRVTDLAISLPGIRFPVDLSGGVNRFRHRRGKLHRLALDTTTTELSAFAAPRLRGILAESAPDIAIIPNDDNTLLIGITRGASALAFDLHLAPLEDDLRLIPQNARATGLAAPPHAHALRVLLALTAPLGRLVQGAVVVPAAATHIARHLLPAAGARAPSLDGVRWAMPLIDHGRVSLEAHSDAPPPLLHARDISALETAELSGAADQAALQGDLDDARRLYLSLLESAPRHVEISQRLAWIDATMGDRPEGALSTLVDAIPATFAGILGARLLASVGDQDGARVAFSRAASAEPYGPLAALAWIDAARLAPELDERVHALDQAIARAPALEAARWARLEARLALADLRGAKADADNLESLARGPEARHTLWRRAAAAFLEHGFHAQASELFERALRYAPSDIDAVLGLARALRAAGQDRRALDLFARAVTLAQRAGSRVYAAEVELSRALAEVAGDRPAAIARARAIPPGEPESIDARFLEGRFRTDIGDLSGASIAFGRLADAVELIPPPQGPRGAEVAAMLVEAAGILEHELDDLASTVRLLGLALRLRPRDYAIAAAFRRAASAIAPKPRPTPLPSPPTPPPESVDEDEDTPPLVLPAFSPPPMTFDDEQADVSAEDEALVEQLTARLRANPSDHETATLLEDALTRLGRDLDLLALLSARMEEGGEEIRLELSPRRKVVLLRLSAAAREAGRGGEADLYEMMASAEED